jgi:ribonuclease HI
VQEYIDKFYGYVKIYTDGSKSAESKVGVAFWVPEFQVRLGKRVNDEVSMYAAEMIAILLAIHWVEETRPVRVTICSDSSSVLTSLQSSKSDSRPDILIEIKQIKQIKEPFVFSGINR